MTREQVNRTLMAMEQCRELSYEAETKHEERRLIREYKAMWLSIEPFVAGRVPYTEADDERS